MTTQTFMPGENPQGEAREFLLSLCPDKTETVKYSGGVWKVLREGEWVAFDDLEEQLEGFLARRKKPNTSSYFTFVINALPTSYARLIESGEIHRAPQRPNFDPPTPHGVREGAELAGVVAAWPKLSPLFRAAILALVKATL